MNIITADRPGSTRAPVFHRGRDDDPADLKWAEDAACQGKDEGEGSPVFFSTEPRGPGQPDPDAEAKAICATCPVQEECLAFALAKPERYGVWGGLGEKERETLRKKTRKPRRPA